MFRGLVSRVVWFSVLGVRALHELVDSNFDRCKGVRVLGFRPPAILLLLLFSMPYVR